MTSSTSDSYDPNAGDFVEFEAPVVDYVKFAGQFWVYLANGNTYVSIDGKVFRKATITISRGARV